MAEVRRSFAVPPEVPRYFADKGLKPRFSWLDVWGEEHAYSFTVAKAVEVELLTTLRDGLKRAIDAGQGFEAWRAELRPELQRLGWWGKRQVSDPLGRQPDKTVDFSAPRRLQTIFSANMRSARAAGQWERIQRTKDALPYLLYVRTTSYQPRPQHLAWAGTILPADDPWWSTHFPPNGWNCKCAVRQVSRREATDKLTQPGYSDERPPLDPKGFLNRRTGEIVRVPDGIDPGWAHNPGLARAQTLVARLSQQLEEAGPAVARRAIGELLQTPAPKVLLGRKEQIRLPVAVAEDLAGILQASSPLLAVANGTMRRKTSAHAAMTVESFTLTQQIVDTGTVVDEGRNAGRARTLFAEIEGQWWELVVVVSETGFMRVQTLHRSDRRKFEQTRRRTEKPEG